MNMLERLDALPKKYNVVICFVFIPLIGLLDYGTAFAAGVEILYLLPVSYAAWYVGRKSGVLFSLFTAVIMLFSASLFEKNIFNDFPAILNRAMYAVLFIIVALLFSQLRSMLRQRAELIAKLQNALDAVKNLSGVLPICANCKKIRDDDGYWHDVDVYIRNHTNAEFSHGLCADCANKLYPSLFDKVEK